MSTKKCEFLDYPVQDPCRATDAQCPKKRLKRKVSAFCLKVDVTPYDETKENEKIYANCRWKDVCIDPCHGCPNMEAVKMRPDGEIDPDTLCPHEQGGPECRQVVCPSCREFEKAKSRYDPAVERIKKFYK
jgi:hypothetical protein